MIYLLNGRMCFILLGKVGGCSRGLDFVTMIWEWEIGFFQWDSEPLSAIRTCASPRCLDRLSIFSQFSASLSLSVLCETWLLKGLLIDARSIYRVGRLHCKEYAQWRHTILKHYTIGQAVQFSCSCCGSASRKVLGFYKALARKPWMPYQISRELCR